MIVMDLYLDNFFAFKNYRINMSYPKKIVDSYIENEYLIDRPNFRYKKVNIFMGANATGKTTLGKSLMSIFNFLHKKELSHIVDEICDKRKPASFSIDFVANTPYLYRVSAKFLPSEVEDNNEPNVSIHTQKVKINKADSYEMCTKKFIDKCDNNTDYLVGLDAVEDIGWLFTYPTDGSAINDIHFQKDSDIFIKVLNNILKSLDPSIEYISKLSDVEDGYRIKIGDMDLLMKSNEVIPKNILSSGTQAGISLASLVTALIEGRNGFYYCDEKFSYIHSDLEKALLTVMINKLLPNQQLFFTTHNTDILDLPLPKHTFNFMKKGSSNEQPIQSVNASNYLKRNTDSLKTAVENDLFATAPEVELIYEINDIQVSDIKKGSSDSGKQ